LLSGPGGRIPLAMPMSMSMPMSAPAFPPARTRRLPPVALLVTGWLLFAFALGVGVLVGWAIWA
jgi:hypothetical protein